jgi:hypothetical protein
MGGGKKSKLNKKMKATKAVDRGEGMVGSKPKPKPSREPRAASNGVGNSDFNNKLENLRARMTGPKRTGSKRGTIQLAAPSLQFGGHSHAAAIAGAQNAASGDHAEVQNSDFIPLNNGVQHQPAYSIDRFLEANDDNDDQGSAQSPKPNNRFAALEYVEDKAAPILLRAPMLASIIDEDDL